MLDGFDGDTPRLRAAREQGHGRASWSRTPPGLGYWFFNDDIVRWEAATGTPNVLSGDDAIFKAPLVADPGTRYEYGINTDWLGRVVEAASGQTLDAYFDEHILGPLGMDAHDVPDDRRAARELGRRSTSTTRTAAGCATDVDWSPGAATGGPAATACYSTPRDYLRFQRMLLGGGTLDGVQILKPETVDAAFTQPDRRPRLPAGDQDRRPRLDRRLQRRPGPEVGPRAAAQQRADSPACARPAAARGPASSTPTSGSTRTTGITGAIYTQTLPFVEPRRLPGLHRLRAGAVRVPERLTYTCMRTGAASPAPASLAPPRAARASSAAAAAPRASAGTISAERPPVGVRERARPSGRGPRAAGPTAPRRARSRRPPAGGPVSATVRITDMTAVPIEAPTCWMMFSVVLARATCGAAQRLHRARHQRHHRRSPCRCPSRTGPRSASSRTCRR